MLWTPFRAAGAWFAPSGPVVRNVSPARLAYNTAVVRTATAPLWRKLVRASVVLTGLAIFAAAQYSMGNLIYSGDWLQVISVYVGIASVILAFTNPPLAFAGWLILSPFGALFLRESIGGKLELNFDRLSLLLLTIVLVSRSLVNRYPVRKLLLPEWLLFGSVFYSRLLPVFTTRPSVIYGTTVLLHSLVTPFAMYCIARACITQKSHLRILIYAVFVMGMLWAVSGWYEHYTGHSWMNPITEAGFGVEVGLGRQDVGKGRAVGPTGHYYTYGEVLTLTTLLAVHIGQWSKKLSLRVFYYLCAVFMTIGLYFNYSRAPYIAFAVGTIAMAMLVGAKRRHFIVFAVLVTLAVGVVYPVLMKDERFARRMLSPKNFYQRVTMLKTGMNIIRDNFWFGVGAGKIGDAMGKYVVGLQHPYFVQYGVRHFFTPHNEYVVVWAEQGLFGFVLFFGGMYGFMFYMLQARRRLPPEGLLGRNFAALVIVFGIVHTVTMFSDQFQSIPYSYFIMYPVFALVVRLDELLQDERKAAAASEVEAPLSPALASGAA